MSWVLTAGSRLFPGSSTFMAPSPSAVDIVVRPRKQTSVTSPTRPRRFRSPSPATPRARVERIRGMTTMINEPSHMRPRGSTALRIRRSSQGRPPAAILARRPRTRPARRPIRMRVGADLPRCFVMGSYLDWRSGKFGMGRGMPTSGRINLCFGVNG